jgi:hypothetical protein
MLRLVCTICRACIVGRDSIEAHVAAHKIAGDAVQAWWAVSNGLVLRPVIARIGESRPLHDPPGAGQASTE